MSTLETRPTTRADLAALTALFERYDTHWFGGPEQDESEVSDSLDLVPSLDTGSLLVETGGRIVGAGLVFGAECSILADPTADDPSAAYAALLPWVEGQHVEQVDVLERDEPLRALLAAYGWTYQHSAFDLTRRLDAAWAPPAPRWPAGVELAEFDEALRDEVHELIYVRSGYADVPGHRTRDAAEWERLFLRGRPTHELPVLARRDGRLVGVAVGRMFSDGTGWVAQLAVDRSEQGSGIGTALMLESYARRRAEGAATLGLSVSATNRGALRLYESIGLRVEREWQMFHRPGS